MIISKKEKTGDYIVIGICIMFIIICLVPLLNVVARSLSSADALIRNEVRLIPKGLNFDAYATVFKDQKYRFALGWTAILTVICTVVSMVMTTMCAYPLTYDKLKGRRVVNAFIIFTMYFSAGTIPNYLLYKDLHLLDNPLVLIIPNCLSVFNIIIMRSFLQNIPESIRESAEIDGAGPIRILISIYLPMSTSVIATLSLFYAVGRWNGFSDALMYMNNNKQFFPIQLLLYNLINSISAVDTTTIEGFLTPGASDTFKSAVVVFATVPILLVYPWLQRFFITGVTLGAEKG